jgi:hypothetical protein
MLYFAAFRCLDLPDTDLGHAGMEQTQDLRRIAPKTVPLHIRAQKPLCGQDLGDLMSAAV